MTVVGSINNSIQRTRSVSYSKGGWVDIDNYIHYEKQKDYLHLQRWDIGTLLIVASSDIPPLSDTGPT